MADDAMNQFRPFVVFFKIENCFFFSSLLFPNDILYWHTSWYVSDLLKFIMATALVTESLNFEAFLKFLLDFVFFAREISALNSSLCCQNRVEYIF